jgi:DNA-binding response OmpR family regulator
MRILLVENDKFISDMIKTVLTYTKYSEEIVTIDQCTNIIDALELMSTNNYQWAIVDMFLDENYPGSDLIDALNAVGTKIIMSTGMYLTNDEKNSFIKRGVNVVLEKPYANSSLINIIFGNNIV